MHPNNLPQQHPDAAGNGAVLPAQGDTVLRPSEPDGDGGRGVERPTSGGSPNGGSPDGGGSPPPSLAHARTLRHVSVRVEEEEDVVPMPEPKSSAAAAAAEFHHPFSLGLRVYIAALFTVMAALLFADQNCLPPNLTAAAQFFGFDATQRDEKLGGAISAAFFAVGAPAALLVGWLADKVNRRNLLVVVAVFGEAPCLLMPFVQTYGQFFLLRVLTGISVGGAFPLLFSLLGDLFPSSQRTLVSCCVQVAMGIGAGGGQVMSAFVGTRLGWRMPFVFVAAPSLLVSLLILLTTREPPKGACEEGLQQQQQQQQQQQGRDSQQPDGPQAYSERITWAKVRLLCMVPSNFLLFTQGLPGCLPWGMIVTFLNDYLQNKSEDVPIDPEHPSHHADLSPQLATNVILVFGVGNAVGAVVGGVVGQQLYNMRKEWMPAFAGACVLASITPTLFLVNGDLARMYTFALLVASLGGVLAGVAAPCVKAATLNVNDPESRGVACAIQTMTDDLGKALGPAIVAACIKRLGRRAAFNLAVYAWAPCGLLILSLVTCMRHDEDAVQERLQRHAAEAAVAAERPPRPPPPPSALAKQPYTGVGRPSTAATYHPHQHHEKEYQLLLPSPTAAEAAGGSRGGTSACGAGGREDWWSRVPLLQQGRRSADSCSGSGGSSGGRSPCHAAPAAQQQRGGAAAGSGRATAGAGEGGPCGRS